MRVGVEKESLESDFVGMKFVSKVIDGDTIIIEGESVRLLGMDTDERGYPCYSDAKRRMEELVLDEGVRVEIDVEDKDQYDRYLRYIFLGDENINLQMVREGLAVARFSPENQKYKSEILAAEKEAREAKIGCKWSASVGGEEIESETEETDSDKKSVGEGVASGDLSETAGERDLECSSNTYNCDDFSSQAEARKVFEACGGVANDVHKLDRDLDGVACETLG